VAACAVGPITYTPGGDDHSKGTSRYAAHSLVMLVGVLTLWNNTPWHHRCPLTAGAQEGGTCDIP
jgi:hypothetical protein